MASLTRILLLLLLSIFLHAHLLHATKIKNFRVSPELTTGWVFCRNQALYTAEFLYEHDKELFWNFFKDLNQKWNIKEAGKSSKSDQLAIYGILPFDKKSSVELLQLLNINLEMESLAPKFQAIAQSQVKLSDKCSDAFIEFQTGQFACSLDDLEGKDIYGIKPGVFDYKQTTSLPSAPIVRIYAIAGTDKFNEFFNVLTEKGFNIVVQLLPKPSNCPFYQEEVHPVGYGLEFELKSSQYVVEEEQTEIPDEVDLDGGVGSSESFNSIDSMKSFSKIQQVPSFQLKALNLFENPKSFDDILKYSTNIPFLSDKLEALKTTGTSTSSSSSKASHYRINGLELKAENFDPFKLIDFLNIYSKVSNEIERITEDKLVMKRILKSRSYDSNVKSQTRIKRFNIQGPSVTFLNNLEKDKRYSDWLKSFSNVQTEENQFYAKNVLNVIFPIKFDNVENAGLIESLVQLVQFGYPIRFGIIPIIKDNADKNWIQTFYYIRDNYGLRPLVQFLTEGIKAYQENNSDESLEILLENLNIEIKSNFSNTAFEDARNISERFDLKEGEVFINGVIFPITSNFPELLMNQYAKTLEALMENPSAYDNSDLYSKMLIESKNERFALNSSLKYEKDHFLEQESISSLLSIGNYLDLSNNYKAPMLLTCWIAVEYDKKATFSFLLQALKTLKSHCRLRIFVSNPMISMPNRIVLASTALLSESPNDFDSIVAFLDNFYENYFGGSIKSLDEMKGAYSNDKVAETILKYAANLDEPVIKEIIKENNAFFAVYSLIDYDESLLFSLNGNTLLIPINEVVLKKISNNLIDIAEMEVDDRANRFSSIAGDIHVTKNILAYSIFERKLLNLIEIDLANFVLPNGNSFPREDSNPISIGNEEISIFHIEAIFNPFNREGQKFSSIMSYLATSDSFMFSFSLHLMTDPHANDPKEARIYRFVTPETRGIPIPIVPVDDEDTLMAMSIDLPSAWMTVTTYSNTDLDNIRPMKVPHVQVSFALNHLTIEGQATSSGENEQIPTGKLIQIYNSQTGLLESETSVMANFGYYQVKASSPGLWTLRASSSIQERQKNGEDFEYPVISGGQVFLKSFGGTFNRLKISSEGIKVAFNRPAPKQADINVFSLASGLFYERLLRIMMTSVMKTKAPGSSVKFWLLETTLSAQGSLALEVLSKKLGFEYELMSYRWPSWLNPQTKKHRTIWAYKILFLDVLFPQNLDRIIFIDADQVVRSDLMELVDLDLKGNVYAMTPFCNDKPEMAPFRFWEHNYWKHHLQGRPYHISALFVVDLLELRKKLVADIIRAQYHMLSQDPNSLSNLDQDLPNNLQHHIPIYPLPQEWLWCDSWCSERTKSKAKTIDLCNNPKTFESKFDQAQRIIPEWKDYDSEIKEILASGRDEYLKNLKNLKSMKIAGEHFPIIEQHLEL